MIFDKERFGKNQIYNIDHIEKCQMHDLDNIIINEFLGRN